MSLPVLWKAWKHQASMAREEVFFCVSTKHCKTEEWKDHMFKWPDRKALRDILKEHPTDDYNLYFCPLPFTKARRRREYVAGSALLWSDLDEADPTALDDRPSVAWQTSPGRYAALWLLDDFYTSGEAEKMNRAMTIKCNGDPGGWDLTQVLRIPQTRNHKYRRSPVGEMLWYENHVVDGVVEDIFEKWKSKIPRATYKTLTLTEATQGKRSEVLYRLERELARCDIPREDVLKLLKASVWNKFKGRRDENRQLQREMDKTVEEIADRREELMSGLRRMSEVQREDVDWLWYPYFARGTFTLVEGDPGLGKSYFMQMVCKSIVDASKMPGGERLRQGPIVYFGVEDDPSTVVKARLADNGCRNQDDYYVYELAMTLDEEGFEAIEEMVTKIEPSMIVFDPLTLYIGGIDMHKANETTQVLERFARLAKQLNCAVIGVRHLTKGGRDKALYRGQGSIAFAGTAREVLTVGTDPDEPDVRVVAVTKLNLESRPKSLTYTIVKGSKRGQSHFLWGEMSDLNSTDILESDQAGKSNASEDAEKWLRKNLTAKLQVKDDLVAKAEAAGISQRTLERIASTIGVKKSRKFGGKTHWSI